MKTINRYMVMAVLPLIAVACSNEETIDNGKWTVDNPKELRLTATVSLTGTRAATDIQTSQIAKGQSVGIVIADALDINTTAEATAYAPRYYKNNQALSVSDTEGTLTGQTFYWPVDGNNVRIYAYTPRQASWNITGTNSFSVKAVQTAEANYKASDLMAGIPEAGNPVLRSDETADGNAIPLVFRHMMSKVTISVTAGTGFANVKTVNGIYIQNTCLDGTVTMRDSTVYSVAPAAGAVPQDIWVAIPSQQTTVRYSAIVLPQTVAAGKVFIMVTTSDGGEYRYELPEDLTLQSATEYKYTIQVNLYGLTVTSSVVPWASEEKGSASLNFS